MMFFRFGNVDVLGRRHGKPRCARDGTASSGEYRGGLRLLPRGEVRLVPGLEQAREGGRRVDVDASSARGDTNRGAQRR